MELLSSSYPLAILYKYLKYYFSYNYIDRLRVLPSMKDIVVERMRNLNLEIGLGFQSMERKTRTHTDERNQSCYIS